MILRTRKEKLLKLAIQRGYTWDAIKGCVVGANESGQILVDDESPHYPFSRDVALARAKAAALQRLMDISLGKAVSSPSISSSSSGVSSSSSGSPMMLKSSPAKRRDCGCGRAKG